MMATRNGVFPGSEGRDLKRRCPSWGSRGIDSFLFFLLNVFLFQLTIRLCHSFGDIWLKPTFSWRERMLFLLKYIPPELQKQAQRVSININYQNIHLRSYSFIPLVLSHPTPTPTAKQKQTKPKTKKTPSTPLLACLLACHANNQ